MPHALRRIPGGCCSSRRLWLSLGLSGSLLLAGPLACSPNDLVGGASLPSTVADPAAQQTPAGALAAYRGTLLAFRTAVNAFIPDAGLLADELQEAGIGGPVGVSNEGLDFRVLPEHQAAGVGENFLPGGATYTALQVVRSQVAQARGLVRQYLPDSSPALVGHLYAVEGLSELFLAELFCSGIPLSTVDYGRDFTLKPGSSTSEVLQQAAAHFDSALTLADDSARILNLTRVGKARALLGLGQYTAAAQAVASVPDDFRYAVYFATTEVTESAYNFGIAPSPIFVDVAWPYIVADREGQTGLDYLSSGDPRSASLSVGLNKYGRTLYHPNKYNANGASPIVVADGIEARLIEAEAALQAHDTAAWLDKLNHLRATAWPTITPAVQGPLDSLSDPGSDTARVTLTFRERAFWLFLTGHRQGDLRRLIRQYRRLPEQVYPIGSYPGGTGSYGTDLTVPIPPAERAYNPQLTGCLNRGA